MATRQPKAERSPADVALGILAMYLPASHSHHVARRERAPAMDRSAGGA